MRAVVVGRVVYNKRLIGIRVVDLKSFSFKVIKRDDFRNFFESNQVVNCTYVNKSLRSTVKEIPLRYMTTFTCFGSIIKEGLYSDSQLIAILTHCNINKVCIKVCGAITGAITDEFSDEADAHAKLYYREVREMSTDIVRIARNTGFRESDIAKVKNYVFMQYHYLETGYKRFDPCFTMALSWQRLMLGNFLPHDITMLKHELLEIKLVSEGLSQNEAHIKAQQKFNYNKEVLDYHAKSNKY